jgi:hypothetical protein
VSCGVWTEGRTDGQTRVSCVKWTEGRTDRSELCDVDRGTDRQE